MNDLNKLPKWAQAHIEKIERERDAAVAQLREFTDEQTPADMWVEDSAHTGENPGPTRRKRYINGRFLEIDHAGVRIKITLALDEVRFSYGTHSPYDGAVWLLPSAHQQFVIKPFPEREDA